LEKEIGDLIDLRAGLGMGVGFISLESDSDYSGESFIYDFGIGASYRFRENVSLALDYRFFLSAAEDIYDRINSHIFTASAQFDL
jgi:opacity protein-like surface antigen